MTTATSTKPTLKGDGESAPKDNGTPTELNFLELNPTVTEAPKVRRRSHKVSPEEDRRILGWLTSSRDDGQGRTLQLPTEAAAVEAHRTLRAVADSHQLGVSFSFTDKKPYKRLSANRWTVTFMGTERRKYTHKPKEAEDQKSKLKPERLENENDQAYQARTGVTP